MRIYDGAVYIGCSRTREAGWSVSTFWKIIQLIQFKKNKINIFRHFVFFLKIEYGFSLRIHFSFSFFIKSFWFQNFGFAQVGLVFGRKKQNPERLLNFRYWRKGRHSILILLNSLKGVIYWNKQKYVFMILTFYLAYKEKTNMANGNSSFLSLCRFWFICRSYFDRNHNNLLLFFHVLNFIFHVFDFFDQ